MTIKEVSQKYNISADTLRYYEKEGLIGKVPKINGKRNYTENEEKNIEFIICMCQAGLSINILKKYISLFKEGESTILQRKKLLEEQKMILSHKIDRMNIALNKLNYKIDYYEKEIIVKEKELLSNLKDTNL